MFKRIVLVGLFLLTMFSFAGAAQHDYVIANAPGVTVRADINSSLQAIVTNNSSATEPATLYPNMWWFDTSTSLLKRRNNANDAWITTGLEAADTDGTLAANSDLKIATQKATKTYSDTKAVKGANSDITSLSGLTTPLSRAQGGLASTVANNAASGVVFLDASSKLPAVDGSQLTGLSAGGYTGMQVFTANGTWTKPAGITKVLVKLLSGGGGGSGDATYGAGGGGGGGYAEGIIAVSGNVTVTVGGGGASNGNGGASSFVGTTTISATGGVGGSAATGGAGGVGTGTLTFTGGSGAAGGAAQGSPGNRGLAFSGCGGAGSKTAGGGTDGVSVYQFWGSGGSIGNNGTGYGSGGGGHINTGGSGSAGLVIVYW